MASHSFLDSILSFIDGAALGGLAELLPGLFFSICEIWFAAVGWNRHRALGFRFILLAGAIGIASHLMWAIAMTQTPKFESTSHMFAFHIASAVNFISRIFAAIGLGHLAYRAKFASSAIPEFHHP